MVILVGLLNGSRVQTVVDWTDVSTGSNYTTNSFTTAALNSTTYFRLAASCNSGNWSDQGNSNVVTVTVPSGTKYVATNGNDSNDGNSSVSPYLTLSHAISQASCGYTINVAAGTYTDDKLDLTSTHDGISIVGAGMGSTIFQQSGSGDHFMEIKNNANTITISDLTIQNYDENNNGAGIDITTDGTVTLEDIHFHNNSTTSSADGAAVFIDNDAIVTVDRCKFTSNTIYNSNSSNGSAIGTEKTLTLKNSLFYDNTCAYGTNAAYSGHIFIRTAASNGVTSIINYHHSENNAGNPVSMYDADGGTVTFKNCLFHNNTASHDVYEKYIALHRCHR